MQIQMVAGAEFHTPKDLDAQTRPLGHSLRHAVNGIVVGYGQDVNPPLLCQPRQLCRGILPVGGGGMGVQISNHSKTPLKKP